MQRNVYAEKYHLVILNDVKELVHAWENVSCRNNCRTFFSNVECQIVDLNSSETHNSHDFFSWDERVKSTIFTNVLVFIKSQHKEIPKSFAHRCLQKVYCCQVFSMCQIIFV